MKFSIRQKLIIISCILLIVPIAVLGTTSYFYAKNQLTQKGETILRNGVQQAMMLIEAKKQEVARGTISLEEAQEEAKTMLLGPMDAEGKRSISKSVDLGGNGYFIVYSTSGDEIMHPTLEGQNVWDAEDKSGNGFKLVQAQIDAAVNGTDGGYVTYAWNLPNSEAIGTKITYQAYDADWGWVVSAGAYEADFNKSAGTILFVILIVLAVSVVIGLAVILVFANHIAKPIGKVSKALLEVSQNNLTMEAIQVKNNDEIGILATSYNTMLQNFRELTSTLRSSSKTVSGFASSLVEVTDQTTSAINEVAQTIQEVARAVSDEASVTEEAVIKVHDLSKRIDSVTDGTKKVEGLAGAAETQTQAGLKAVEKLLKANTLNNESTEQIAAVIAKVSESTEKIHMFTDTITGISEQTNLLALNASIEAARAGEAGRGFAVVAEEIRKLAEQSAVAVGEIQGIISEIDGHSKRSVESVQELKVVSEQQNQAVTSTQEQFSSIAEGIKALTNIITDIEKETFEMNQMKDHIVDAMTGISASTEETSASTEEVSAATEEQLAGMVEIHDQAEKLSGLATELEQTISKFKL